MRLFDARVGHLDEDSSVLLEGDHELLFLLHLTERVLGDNVRVMEEEVVLARQLHLHVLDLVWTFASLSQLVVSRWLNKMLGLTIIMTLMRMASKFPTSYKTWVGSSKMFSQILNSKGASLSNSNRYPPPSLQLNRQNPHSRSDL